MIIEKEIIEILKSNIFEIIECRFDKHRFNDRKVTEKSVKHTARIIMDKIKEKEMDINKNQILINCHSKKEMEFLEKEIIKILISYREKK